MTARPYVPPNTARTVSRSRTAAASTTRTSRISSSFRLATGDARVRFIERTTLLGNVASGAALADERGVLIGENDNHGGRLRQVRLDGTTVRTWDLNEIPQRVHATNRVDRAWIVGVSHATLIDVAR
jgi:hypothetical protein